MHPFNNILNHKNRRPDGEASYLDLGDKSWEVEVFIVRLRREFGKRSPQSPNLISTHIGPSSRQHHRKHLCTPRRVALSANWPHPIHQWQGRRVQLPLGVQVLSLRSWGLSQVQRLFCTQCEEYGSGSTWGDFAWYWTGVQQHEWWIVKEEGRQTRLVFFQH